jgi:hypothetical protein
MGISDDIGVGIVVEEFGAGGIIKIKGMVSLVGLFSDKEITTKFALEF